MSASIGVFLILIVLFCCSLQTNWPNSRADCPAQAGSNKKAGIGKKYVAEVASSVQYSRNLQKNMCDRNAKDSQENIYVCQWWKSKIKVGKI